MHTLNTITKADIQSRERHTRKRMKKTTQSFSIIIWTLSAFNYSAVSHCYKYTVAHFAHETIRLGVILETQYTGYVCTEGLDSPTRMWSPFGCGSDLTALPDHPKTHLSHISATWYLKSCVMSMGVGGNLYSIATSTHKHTSNYAIYVLCEIMR